VAPVINEAGPGGSERHPLNPALRQGPPADLSQPAFFVTGLPDGLRMT
jgi:hypothetical protein